MYNWQRLFAASIVGHDNDVDGQLPQLASGLALPSACTRTQDATRANVNRHKSGNDSEHTKIKLSWGSLGGVEGVLRPSMDHPTN